MPTSANSSKREKDAVDLLDADHKAVKAMFTEYDSLTDSNTKKAMARKQELSQQICEALTVHAKIEEEIFYPAMRAKTKDQDMMDEADVEHAGAKDLIAQIEGHDCTEDHFDAKVKVLGEYIDHHVKEERTTMFPQARAARGLDLVALRVQLEARKAELTSEVPA